ncbi:MAG: HAD family hydrolase [Myxococcota bacterium]|nr:HAD family hydrolase [Myxococcota bacterium]
MAYRALLIDLDDTLFDRTAALRAWGDTSARAQLGRPLAAAEWELLVELDGRGHRSREAFAADARDRLGLSVDAPGFGHLLVEHIAREPGVLETVTQLAETKRIAIVTNGGAAQRAKLCALGLDGIVHAVFVSGELGSDKPALEIFERALRWTEHAAADVLFVGDDPVIDLAPAALLGMATAWRARGSWPRELALPTHRIESITELAAL